MRKYWLFIGASIRHEIALLAAMVQKEDDCWELKLNCMMSLFQTACEDSKSPTVMESVTLPCLKIIQNLMKISDPPAIAANGGGSKKSKEKSNNGKGTQKLIPLQAPAEVRKFLNKAPGHSFTGKCILVGRIGTRNIIGHNLDILI